MDDLLKALHDYLPPVLTQPDTIFLFIIAFSVYGYVKTYGKSDRYPFLPQAITMAVSLLLGIGLRIGNSIVYGEGTGIIAAALATIFYDTAFFWLTEKLRSYFGRPTPTQTPPPPKP